jgi:aspartokinase-like uncharacterized kinase
MPRAGGEHLRGAPVVVKLGGSLFEGTPGGAGAGPSLLALLHRATTPVVVVPGGGGFADLVRAEQERLGLVDTIAHRMALIAMHQMALVLVSLAPDPPRLVVAAPRSAIDDALTGRRIPVWVPLPMTDRDLEIPEDWSITSDGLALWLARRLRARHVALVKAADVPAGLSAADLAARGIVDPYFSRHAAASGIPWSVCGSAATEALADLVGAAMQPGADPPATTAAEVRRR